MTEFSSPGARFSQWINGLLVAGSKPARQVRPFFDALYYQRDSGRTFSSERAALAHFVTQGWKQGFSPCACFSIGQYLAAYPDVRDSGQNPLLHFLDFGWRENRQAFTASGEVCELLGYQSGGMITLGERPRLLHLEWPECARVAGWVTRPPQGCTEVRLESRGELIGLARLEAVERRCGDLDIVERFHFDYYLPPGIGEVDAKIADLSSLSASAQRPNLEAIETAVERFITSPQNQGASAIAPCSAELVKQFIRHKRQLVAKTHGNEDVESGEKIAIIMPVYNRENLVDQAIRSVARQTYSNWELILVDDGSSDNSVAAIHQALKKYRIEDKAQLIELPANAGVSHARNQGLNAAEAPLIAYLDSDNSWDKDYLQLVADSFARNPQAQSVYSGQYVYFYNQVLKQSYMAGIRIQPFHREKLTQGNYIDLNIFAHRRSLYDKLGGFNEDMRRLVDWDLVLRYSEQAEPLLISALLARYNLGIAENQITSSETYQLNFNVLRENRLTTK